MKHIAIAGANGFVGQALQNALENIVVLNRNDSVEILVEKLKDVDVVINLAGLLSSSIGMKLTKKYSLVVG